MNSQYRIDVYHVLRKLVEASFQKKGVEVHLCAKTWTDKGIENIGFEDIDDELVEIANEFSIELINYVESKYEEGYEDGKTEIQDGLKELLNL